MGKLFQSCAVFMLLAIIVGLVMSFGSVFASEKLDLADGGNAQVIRLEPPAEGVDQDFAKTYKTIAEGNKANAEGDAATTLANATARNTDAGTFLGYIVVAVVLGGVLFVFANIKS